MGKIFDWVRRFATATDTEQPAKPESAAAAPGADDFVRSATIGMSRTLSSDALKQILAAANEGTCREQAWLFGEIQDKEAVIAAHLQTRKLAVLGCEWGITSEGGKYAAQAETMQRMLRKAGIAHLHRHLLDVLAHGYAGAVTDWAEGGKAINGWRMIHPEAWEFDQSGNPALLDAMGKAHPFGEYHPAQLVYVLSGMKPGLPCRGGLLRSLVWCYLFKSVGYRNWSRFVEKFGIPFVVGKMDDVSYGDAAKKNKLLADLLKICGVGAGTVTKSTDVEFLNAAADGNTATFETFCRYMDEIFTLLILGQLASSATAGGLSKGDAQSQVRQDILEADCAMLAEADQRFLVQPLAEMAFGLPAEHDVEIWIDGEPPTDLAGLAKTWLDLANATGKKIDPKDAEDRFGVKLVDGPAPPPAAAPGPPVGEKIPLSDAPSGMAGVVEEAMRRTVADQHCLAEWLDPVKQAIAEIFAGISPEDPDALAKFKAKVPELLKRLPGLAQDMDPTRFQDELAAAMLAGALNGYLVDGGATGKA
jgi:phage gp29-like protein